MEKIRARKENMTQIFADSGEVLAVTLVKLESGEDASKFSDGDNITVSGISKGKGFQGVVKRHKFKGGRRSHGQKHSEREPGSIGGGGRAGGRVAKGMRMGGRMGSGRTTVKNLHVVKILPDTGEIFISGAVPGRRGAKVEIRTK
jgi:large subunit ribosomal protein L3